MEDEFYSDFLERINDFHNNEPRAFCFDLALSLINTAKADDLENWYYHNKTIEGILLLLFCWNFASPITKKLTKQRIESLLRNSKDDLISLEQYSIANINENAHQIILRLFKEFKNTFGQTGASKALSLLNTKLFIMWDTKIRRQLVRMNIVSRIGNGENPEDYLQYLLDIKNVIQRNQLTSLINNPDNIAKKIDEFHYAKIVVGISNINQNV
ncbi:MAG: hypothetical protein N3D80_06955 [Ignavibacterium album]|uniref:hypothetical protein n=1 Tax=Ignavibacterium album TaxID=591197 RepID=UPI0026F06602|nr:hypothetical protein [Ignavibacterium album]MCX8105590.1 hypothetical protein [Ignavibacterium album]